jgi:hypothetical protein
MHLVQILLPLFDNEGRELPAGDRRRVRDELALRFGGVTAFTRAPAEGLWKGGEGRTSRDEIVVLEVMAADLDEAWWRAYREGLEARFRQEEVVVRALPMLRL